MSLDQHRPTTHEACANSARARVGVAILVLLVTFSRADTVAAAYVHSLLDAHCKRTTGVLVHVDDVRVALVDLAGHFKSVDRGQVTTVVLHKTVGNPMAKVVMDDRLRGHLRRVWVGQDSQPAFIGWPTAFFDDLFMFFDLEGQVHVLDPDEIRRIRPVADVFSSVAVESHTPTTLLFPQQLTNCPESAEGPGGVTPTRVIADRIKVSDYLAELESSFAYVAGFEERTLVYARPFLFDEKYRLGLTYFQDVSIPFPLYFRWSNGRPYRFQSTTTIGLATSEWLPQLGPSLLASSDIKSHFFSASFVGNLASPAAGGNPFVIEDSSGGPDSPAGQSGPGRVLPMRYKTSFNYQIIMGLDWWRLSGGAGPMYSAHRITDTQGQDRTVLADRPSLVLRLMYRGPHVTARGLYFRTRIQSPLSSNENRVPSAMRAMNIPPEVSTVRVDAIRLGATVSLPHELSISLDQLLSTGNMTTRSNDVRSLNADFRQASTGLCVSASFGRYVTVRGFANLSWFSFEGAGQGIKSAKVYESQFGGALEFVF